MKRLLPKLGLLVLALPGPSQAQVVDDPVHWVCVSGCSDTGAQTPIAQGSGGVTNFGFSVFPSGQLQVQPFAAVPGPMAGAGFPGLVSALGGLLWLARRRRKRQGLAL